MWSSDVFHPLHMLHVYNEVIKFLISVCLPYFLNNFVHIKWDNITLSFYVHTSFKNNQQIFWKGEKKSVIHYVTELCDSLTICVRECLCRLCFWENSLLHTLQIYCFSLLWVCWWDARCPLLEKALLHMSHL
jgi:hypothetical protein